MTRIPENAKIRPSGHEPKFGNCNNTCRDNYAETAEFSLNFFFMNTRVLNVRFRHKQVLCRIKFYRHVHQCLVCGENSTFAGNHLLLTEP